MTTKQWLERGRKLDREINALKEARSQAFELACIRAGAGDGSERVQTSKINVSEKRLVRLADLEGELGQKIEELCRVKREILKVVESVEDSVLRTLLVERYINGKTWEQVSEGMHYNCRWVLRLHQRALEAVEEAIASHMRSVL